jgi:hypothetical protein
MALFTAPSERTIVLVILVMATCTTGGQFQFSEYRGFMAIGTLEILVLALQLETGLVVVEIPIFPVARVVTSFAIRAQRTFMHILLFMARPAVRLGVLISGGQVAFLAFNYLVLSGQRIARLYMTKFGLFPGLFTVANFTFLPFLPLVLVVFLVT